MDHAEPSPRGQSLYFTPSIQVELQQNVDHSTKEILTGSFFFLIIINAVKLFLFDFVTRG